jgi:hypothetical protein
MRENRLKAIIRECIEDLINEGREDANIRQATPDDYRDILRMAAEILPYPVSLLDNFVQGQGGINYDISVVAEDNEGKLVGMSTCTNGRIEDAYPGVMHSERELMEALSNKKYVMGFGLFMEKEYRGRLPRKLMSAMVSNARSTGADFLVVPVDNMLKTHNMYLHAGCVPFATVGGIGTLYMYPFNDDVVELVREYAVSPTVRRFFNK